MSDVPEGFVDGPYEVFVVGESFYTEGFQALQRSGVKQECYATLTAQPENPYDPNAVSVTIAGHQVGHLSRDDAAKFCPSLSNRNGSCVVRAMLVLGGDEHYSSVRVWLPAPDAF